MNLWNTKNLPMPPINTYKAVNTKIDIKHLNDVFEEGRQFFDGDKYMYAEYAVLSRIVYRMKQKFRSAKDFKALEKINKALDNYFKTDISKTLKCFMQLIPSRCKTETSTETYLPTKNLLDYILVRLQGLVKLMERIVETCKIAAYLLDKRIHTGHFWKVAFLTFSIVSRLYVLAKYTAKFICEFYGKLIPFSSQLSNTSRALSDYTFPKDLKEWMNVDWLEIDDEIQIIEIPTEVPDIIQFFDLVDDDDDEVQFCDEYVMIKDEEDMDTKENLKKISKMNFKNLWELRGFDTREDVGEVIEINDSIKMAMENSFSQKTFNGRNDTKNILNDTDNKHDIIAVSDTSGLLEDSNVDSDGDNGDFILQLKKPKTEMEEKPIIVTVDTPLIKRKKNKIRNKRVKKLKVENNEDDEEDELICDIDNEIKIEDDTIITLSDNSLMETIDENVVKTKKKTKKRNIQKRDINMGNSHALINRVDASPMERKLKMPQIGGISVKKTLELTENTEENTDTEEPTTSFNKNINDNGITKKNKIRKNKKNRVKKDELNHNLEGTCIHDIASNAEINNVLNSNNELSNKMHDLPSKLKKRKQSPHLEETVKQESGEPSTSNSCDNSKKKKIQTCNNDFEKRKVENLKKALLINERSKKRLEANLSKALQKLHKKKSSGETSLTENVQVKQELQQIRGDIKELVISEKINMSNRGGKQKKKRRRERELRDKIKERKRKSMERIRTLSKPNQIKYEN